MTQPPKDLRTTLIERTRELCSIGGLAGHESPVAQRLAELLDPYCDSVEFDAVGNLYATKNGKSDGPTLVIAAHTDEVGMMVKSIEPDGFIRFERVGRVPASVLSARVVRVNEHLGVVGAKAGHYQRPDEQSPGVDQMYIDIGAASANEVSERGVRVGDPIHFVSELLEFGRNDDFIMGKALDNRVCCALLISLLEAQEVPAGKLVAVFCVQEEVGLKGAGVATRRVSPDIALALDTMPCGDTPEMDSNTQLSARLNGGPCFQVLSGEGGRGFILPAIVRDFLVETAEQAGVPHQLVMFTGGNNDAATLAWSGDGTLAGSVCVARRYAHSPVEVASVSDLLHTYRFLQELVERIDRLPAGGDYRRT